MQPTKAWTLAEALRGQLIQPR